MSRRHYDISELKVFVITYIVLVTVTLAAWWP